jgi:FixH
MKTLISLCIVLSVTLFTACNDTPNSHAAKLTSHDTSHQNLVASVKKTAASPNEMSIDYIYEANTIILNFPQNQPAPTGKVTFFSPTKAEKNRIFELKPDLSKRMFIMIDGFEKGVWRIKVEWQAEDKVNVYEESINLEPNEWARPIHK